jgi:hypothetical protein
MPLCIFKIVTEKKLLYDDSINGTNVSIYYKLYKLLMWFRNDG